MDDKGTTLLPQESMEKYNTSVDTDKHQQPKKMSEWSTKAKYQPTIHECTLCFNGVSIRLNILTYMYYHRKGDYQTSSATRHGEQSLKKNRYTSSHILSYPYNRSRRWHQIVRRISRFFEFTFTLGNIK